MGPRVSVVIPAYNAERYVAQAVRSALAQTVRDIEVLVVDDASTDGTVAVVEGFSDRRLKLMVNKRNLGPSYTRNRAIREAGGEWVALLDSDDWFAPERVERLLRVAEAESADLIADDAYLIEDGAKHPWSTLLSEGDDTFDAPRHVDTVAFVESNIPGRPLSRLGLTKPLIKRELLSRRDPAYKEDVRYGEDFLLYLDCLLDGARFIVLPEAHYYYRRRRGSLLTEGKLECLTSFHAETLRLLGRERVKETPGLVRALSERFLAIEERILYFRIVQPLKEGSFSKALGEIIRNPGSLVLLFRQIPRSLGYRVRRMTSETERA